jgi:hypothetical protein
VSRDRPYTRPGIDRVGACRDLRLNKTKLYTRARKLAVQSLTAHSEHEAASRLPVECPYTLDQLLDDDFLPGLESGVTR